ncbi:MAG: hypothetical protein EZS28_047720 [Streblomastix strix]|uniref:Uncharacterized protein n=1 Tax=Streblomastix strix TaxID=222440 RepID=A0A5J4TE87_9EUKA|nr:MAG: hypothetical protein EZS28_047720 [Streblomastix strix]
MLQKKLEDVQQYTTTSPLLSDCHHVPLSPKFVQKLVDYIAEEDKIKANHEVEHMKLYSSRYTAFILISISSFEIKRLKRRFLSSARGVKGTRSLEWGKHLENKIDQRKRFNKT